MSGRSEILTQVDLSPYNTFGLPVHAERYLRLESAADLEPVLQRGEPVRLVLGGGSNILFAGSPEGLIVHNRIQGRSIQPGTGEELILVAGAGENWHELVSWSLENGLFGLENLSLIPGTLGAAPIQNIGAYGIELAERFAWLEALELATGQLQRFTPEECSFGYRYSFFKGPGKGKFLITRVALRLSRKPDLRLDYGDIRHQLQEEGITNPDPKDVGRAVIAIRRSKLPDPAELGNAGSFFKNPVVTNELFSGLVKIYPEIPGYPQADGSVKIPAGWLIEQCGWKGKRIGNTGCHARQALVIVNYGGASGAEILEHAQRVEESVLKTFGIRLEREVNVIE